MDTSGAISSAGGLGTSRPRLSTYLSGKVTPSASLMLRMRRVAAQAQARDGWQLPDRH